MPGTLDLNNYFPEQRRRGGSSVSAPGLRERILAAQVAEETQRRSQAVGATLEGPVHRAVTRAVKQTDFRRLMDERIQSQAREFAQANPASLTGRLLSRAAAQPPEERLGQLGSGQFRGSEIAKRKARARQYRYRGA